MTVNKLHNLAAKYYVKLFNQSIIKQHTLLTTKKASVFDLNASEALFAEILNSGLPFGYQQANCHNISHYISLLLESKGYTCAKIWAFAPGVYAANSSHLITFSDQKNISPTGKIDWGYHVAPVIEVKEGDIVQKMVIDVGLFPNGPVPYTTWLTQLRTENIIYLIMDSEWYLYNSSMIPNSQLHYNSNSFSNRHEPNIKLPDWFSDKLITDFFRYEEEALNQHWIEQGLAVNETAIAFYDAEIKPILNAAEYQNLVYDYKMMVGNVYNFETVFRDDRWNYEMTTNFQFKHQKIIAKYREIYFSNLKKWQEALASLNEIIHKKNIE